MGTGGTSVSVGTGSGNATFTINIAQSTAVATVEIVAWSVNVSIDSAVINFGRDQSNFEFQARSTGPRLPPTGRCCSA